MQITTYRLDSITILAKVVDLLDYVPMEDLDTKGDLYEYNAGGNRYGAMRHIDNDSLPAFVSWLEK